MTDLDKLASFMIAHGIATGPGDTLDDLLMELGGALDNYEAEIRRLRDVIVSRWRLAKGKGLWYGPATECDAVLANGLIRTDPAEATTHCDHHWETVNPRIFDGQRCLRCGIWR